MNVRFVRLVSALAVTALTLLFSMPGAGAQQAEAPAKEGRVGDATIVKEDSSSGLAGGGSATSFGLKLPDGAACPGDSLNDDWRVSSFIVPETDDPGTFTFAATKPDGDGRYALYTLDTRSYVNRFTTMAESPGGPGPIDEVPVFNLGLYTGGRLAEGNYRIGLACTLYNDVYRYWDTQIVVTAVPSDQPAQLTWKLASGGSQGSDNSSFLFVPFVIVGAVVVLIAVLIMARHRSGSRPASVSKEKIA